MFKRIIAPIGFLVFLIYRYDKNRELIHSVSFQTAVLFCVVLILVALLKGKLLTSKPAILIISSLLSVAILSMVFYKETLAIACTISLSFLLLLVCLKKYNKFDLSYFFKQLINGHREVNK